MGQLVGEEGEEEVGKVKAQQLSNAAWIRHMLYGNIGGPALRDMLKVKI